MNNHRNRIATEHYTFEKKVRRSRPRKDQPRKKKATQKARNRRKFLVWGVEKIPLGIMPVKRIPHQLPPENRLPCGSSGEEGRKKTNSKANSKQGKEHSDPVMEYSKKLTQNGLEKKERFREKGPRLGGGESEHSWGGPWWELVKTEKADA